MATNILMYGHTDAFPQLAMSTLLVGYNLYQFNNELIPVGSDGSDIVLSLWSGKLQIELQFMYDVAPTIPAYMLIDPVYAAGLVLTPTPLYTGSLVYRGIWTIQGARQSRTLKAMTGTGYGTVEVAGRVTFYGSEENP